LRVHLPQEEARTPSPGHRAPLFRAGKSPAPMSLTSRNTLIHLPYSMQATDDFPNEIFLYSNYNVSKFLARLFKSLTRPGLPSLLT
jgi:hypothetical protein